MAGIADSVWERIVSDVRSVADRAARAGARTHDIEVTPQRVLLQVAFDDPQRAALYMDYHRPSASVCGGFGEEDASFSDYPVTRDTLHWFSEIMHAVADGKVHADVFTLWGRTVHRCTTLDLGGVPTRFSSGFPLLERLPHLTIRRRTYQPW